MTLRTLWASALAGLVMLALCGCGIVFQPKPTVGEIAGTYVYDDDSTFTPVEPLGQLHVRSDGTLEARDFPSAALGWFDEPTLSFRGTWKVLDRETPLNSYRVEFTAELPEAVGGDSAFVGMLSFGESPRKLSIWIDPDGDEVLKLVRIATGGGSAAAQPYSSWGGSSPAVSAIMRDTDRRYFLR
jgi:hypothetical protein